MFALYHASLGMEIIGEDYIRSTFRRKVFNGFIWFVNITTFTFVVFTIILGFNKMKDIGEIQENTISVQQQIETQEQNNNQ